VVLQLSARTAVDECIVACLLSHTACVLISFLCAFGLVAWNVCCTRPENGSSAAFIRGAFMRLIATLLICRTGAVLVSTLKLLCIVL